jgi:hypothetical protein
VATGYTFTTEVLVTDVITPVLVLVLVLEAANWPTLPFWAPVATGVTAGAVATNGTVRVRVEYTPERDTVVVVVTIGIVAAGGEGLSERRV